MEGAVREQGDESDGASRTASQRSSLDEVVVRKDQPPRRTQVLEPEGVGSI